MEEEEIEEQEEERVVEDVNDELEEEEEAQECYCTMRQEHGRPWMLLTRLYCLSQETPQKQFQNVFPMCVRFMIIKNIEADGTVVVLLSNMGPLAWALLAWGRWHGTHFDGTCWMSVS